MKKVLIIDDDRDTLDILGHIAKQSNVEGVLRSDVLPVTEIEQINPDLIFLDHLLTTKTGGELCLEIKKNEATKDTPVILLSAFNKIGQIANDSGADGCLEKPFDITEIQGVIEAYIDLTMPTEI